MNKRIIIGVLSLLLSLALPGYAQERSQDLSTFNTPKELSSFAIKTNLLYDAVLVPNIGIEARLFKTFTIYADVMYAGWNFPEKYIYWNLYGAQVGARQYFGQKSNGRSFTGHHAGAYAQALAYDLQAGNIGQQTTTLNIAGGFEYGYSVPVARNLNIDFELGIGYMSGSYDEYDVHDGHNTWRATIQRKWFGPTKASVSLVWQIEPRTRTEIKIDKKTGKRK